MSSSQIALGLAVSLALGLLIGLERGWKERDAQEGTRVAGLRTFGLLGLFGGTVGLLSEGGRNPVLGFAFVALAAILATAYAVRAQRSDDVGLTSVVAGVVTFALGAMATRGYVTEAAAVAVVTTIVLGVKPLLHGWLQALENHELYAGLKLLLVSLVVLPVLPDRGYGPWNALNPYAIWWMVVLIATISFSGYLAMKLVGARRGVVITGLLAGLASSTALTLHFSRLATRYPESRGILATGILIACGTMFPRMLVVASVIEVQLLGLLVAPAAVMAGATYASAALIWWRAERPAAAHDEPVIRNPLELGSAITFGVLLAVVLLAGKGLQAWAGDSGVLALAAVSGIADVDAITLALSRMGGGDIALRLAALGIVLAAAVNSTVKALMSAFIGGSMLAVRVAFPLLLAAVAGLGVAWLGGPAL